MDIVHRIIAPSKMGMIFIIVLFHYNLIVKLIRGMESGTFPKELVSVFYLRKYLWTMVDGFDVEHS
jgi:hypothetical protein